MTTRHLGVAALVVAIWALSAAQAQDMPPPGRMPGAMFMRGGAAMRGMSDSLAELGEAIPAVREELLRHREAMLDALKGHLSLANELDRALRALREGGAEGAALEEAARKFAPQAAELAAKRAAEMATHYANLGKILADALNPKDEAKRKAVVTQLAEALLKRMASQTTDMPGPMGGRFGGMMPGPGGEGPGGRGERVPRGEGEKGGRPGGEL